MPPNGTGSPPPGRASGDPFFAKSNSLVTNQTHSGDDGTAGTNQKGSGTTTLGGRLGRGVGLSRPGRDRHGWVTSRPAGIGHGKAWRQAGVVLSFAAWPAGWASPSRRGRGVGLLWVVVRCSGCTDLRKEKKKNSLLIYKKISLLTSCSSTSCYSIFFIFFFFFFFLKSFSEAFNQNNIYKKINVNIIQR
jgi:hypothetical protein